MAKQNIVSRITVSPHFIKCLFFVLLIALSIMMVIPPLYYGYVYPTAGDDTATHLIYFQHMESQDPLYYGQYIIGEVLNALPFDPKMIFLWFHFIVLIITLWAIGISVSVVANYFAGILAVFLAFGISYLLSLFYWGQIFDIIGIAIFLPLTLVCFHNMSKGVGWGIGATIGAVCFSVFHLNGQYLYALLPIIVAYEFVRWLLSRSHKDLGKKMEQFRWYAYLASLSLVLFVLYKLNYSGDAGRLLMDGSILFIMFIATIFGVWLYPRTKIGLVVSALIVVAIAMPNLIQWMHDNSAVKQADKDAIAYLNGLDDGTYVADSNVSGDIYGLFIGKEFVNETGTEYIIVRSVPMTPRSDVTTVHYENLGREWVDPYLRYYDNYKLLKVFDSGEIDRVSGSPIIVQVYGK